LLFTFILIAGLALDVNYSYASSKNFESSVEEGEGTNSQESADIKSEESFIRDTPTNESLSTPTKGSNSNDTSKEEETFSISPELLDKQSSPTRTNVTSNLSNDSITVPKRGITIDEDALSQTLKPSLYRVQVAFDIIHVSDNHEGLFSGTGEFDLAAYVQGRKVSLTDAAKGKLWDVGEPFAATFRPQPAVTVSIPSTSSLSIFTVGSEVDGCGRTAFPGELSSVATAVLDTDINKVGYAIREIQKELNNVINQQGCTNENDILGTINKVYNVKNGFGAGFNYAVGVHEVTSGLSDFRLTYNIRVYPP
jgi:hypothetical protein